MPGNVVDDDIVTWREGRSLVSAPSLAEPTDTDLHLEDLCLPYGGLRLHMLRYVLERMWVMGQGQCLI